ncbi:hypothetical protein FN846DRAFT_130032 [Sphaerosporella brunnea]|uniref:DUF7492 domain-containing protein n=1 Tax=Sphaerosporella brunnea TaxID=1250544 RepID=A0A5J5F835_9PEZI|nr:hypothetical protein FN846DRAFT_130032 [Sphaerosporella brunnea]
MRFPVFTFTQAFGFFLGLVFLTGASGHSWIDLLTVVGGTSSTAMTTINHQGFIRNYKGHIDATASYRLLDLNQPVCADFQQVVNQIGMPEYPQLNASAGDFVQGTYTENGHISLPASPTAKSGMTYWFGTTNPNGKATLKDILAWKDGNSSEGALLSTAPFDDGVCVEVNPSEISKERVAANGGVPPGPCKSTFKIPETVAPDSVYTVYWVWDFSGKLGNDAPDHVEWYTSCMDIKIIGKPSTNNVSSPNSQSAKVPKIKGREPKL